MHQTMEKSILQEEKEFLYNLESDVKLLQKELSEIVKAIVDGGYSKFPVVLAHPEKLAIAQQVIDKDEYHTNYNYSASTLEELTARSIVVKEREEDFKKQFLIHTDKYCVLLVHPQIMKFIFTAKG